ncbi:MAG: elongation factor 4, partial [Patescibacteria group bacterium]
LGLVVIPVLNKIDLPIARKEETKKEIAELLNCEEGEILEVSGKTGQGVGELLNAIVKHVPPPSFEFEGRPRALIFDFEYSIHQGVIVYLRMTDGVIKKGDELTLSQAGERFMVAETGVFSPERTPVDSLLAGTIGYVVTNIKKTNVGIVGDSVVSQEEPLSPLSGYMQPKPVVWASVYPESQKELDNLRRALELLRLSDGSLTFEEESSGALGRGFRSGFLGMLHLEIIIERLKREFGLKLVIATPTITYKIQFIDGREEYIYSPIFFPDEHQIKKIFETWIDAQIIIPPEKLGSLTQLLHEHEAEMGEVGHFGRQRTIINAKMPLRELMRNFFDELKSVTAGYGSLNYKISEMREAPKNGIARLDIFMAEEAVPAFTKIVSKARMEREAKESVEKLQKLIPRALFAIKIQAKAMGRILAARSIAPLKKNVTGHLYGGDRTRKMKLWQKQKKGKEKLRKLGKGKVDIPNEVFIKMM